MPSPTPMKCTGSRCFSASATRMPPRAVPSSLVITSPVTPAILLKISTCDSAFCPAVASSTSSTACGAVGVELPDHANDLFELVHQLGLVLQPAGGVDQQHVDAFAPWPLQRVEGETRGIGARARAITGEPVRSPQILSCSIAAARKVSPAASITLRPSARSLAASLPIVVVLPEPLTPTTRMTKGFCVASIDQRLCHRRQDFLHFGRDHGFHIVGRNRLVVAAVADRGRDPRRDSVPRSARSSTSSRSSSMARIELALGDEIGDRGSERTRGPLQPPLDSRRHQLICLFECVVHGARVSGFAP